MRLSECVTVQSQRMQKAGVSFGHGTTNAHDEAVWLVLWSLGLPLDDLHSVAERKLSAKELVRINELIDERIHTRKPAAYLTHEAWLQGVPFYVDERVIVPRSLIAEVLADGSIDAWLSENNHSVLDLCTGNGSLAVLTALAYPDVKVTASDLSMDALAVAKINIKNHALEDRVSLAQGDAFAALAGERFDLILCNPPYVNTASMQALPSEFKAEPSLALAGGTDGMDFIKRLINETAAHLTPYGVLVLEIGHEIKHFERAFPKLEAVWLETSAGDEQVLLLTREALTKQTL